MKTIQIGSGSTLDERSAITAAIGCFQRLYGQQPGISQPDLEEIEKTKDGKYWHVTLSFEAPRIRNPKLPDFLNVPVRKLKVFKVDVRTGEVLSMKMHPAT